ncbi:MAG: hypothetical protein IJX44_03725, partial [Bacteroidaceae bacterium]|nr:hypothetical protein [Bacteroidaceae bacterium]
VPASTIAGSGVSSSAALSTPSPWERLGWGLPLFTLQIYHSVPMDVKRVGRSGGDLTLSHDGYWQWL